MAKDKVKPRKAERQFLIRDSVLSECFRTKHGKSVYNFVVCVFFIMWLRNAINDLYFDGRSKFGLLLLGKVFGKLHLAFPICLLCFLVHISTYFGWKLWTSSIQNRKHRKLYTGIFLTIVFVLYALTLHFAVELCNFFAIPVGSRLIVIAEQWQYIMKAYAFMRVNCEKAWTENNFIHPTFSQYLYFSRAPTFLFRTEYPRVAQINWERVLKYMLEIFVALYFLSLIEMEYFVKPLQDFGKKQYSGVDLVLIISTLILPGFLCTILSIQVLYQHSVPNFMAELTRFGDRKFYGDWWTKTNISDYLTNWNTYIQEWLYLYVYKDLYSLTKNKAISRTALIAISTIFHEIIFYYSFKMFFPIFIITFTLTAFLMMFRPTSKTFNLVLVFQCLVGDCLLWLMPHLEYFARMNCSDPRGFLVFYSCIQK